MQSQPSSAARPVATKPAATQPLATKPAATQSTAVEREASPAELARPAPPPASVAGYRPPAVPLVTHDPYFSTWSCADRLTDDWPKHWTGAATALCGLARIDGRTWRFCGPQPRDAEPMKQTRLEIWPTRTIYEFEAGGVRLTVTFLSPLLASDMELLARPVTYVTVSVESLDKAGHEAAIYLDASAEWAVHSTDQPVVASRFRLGDMAALRIGTSEQAVLSKAGDNVRIDWGYFYLAMPEIAGRDEVIAGHEAARRAFLEAGKLPEADDMRFPRPAGDDWPVMAVRYALGRVEGKPAERTLLLAYDDKFSIEYFERKLRPYWRRNGLEFDALLKLAAESYPGTADRCRKFDAELVEDLERVGGVEYARIAILSYRQCIAAHKLAADFDGTPLMFPKENFSNGCISTVDVIYPSAPLFLLLNPRLLEAQLVPILDYARGSRWPHPFAPHDLGTYPLANGQVYGGGERSLEGQMPVEESANMLLLLAAMTRAEGKPRVANRTPAVLRKWAEYLDDNGFDPPNQLCTDDFAGPLAHNANLSVKAILALGAYAQILERNNKAEDAKVFRQVAESMVRQWVEAAREGDHFRLAFDKPGTWSQKYNLVWDAVLGLELFPPEVAQVELASYRARVNRYGLPLDNRETYTKLDWCVWTAAISGRPEDFAAFVRPLAAFAAQTPQRVPLTDWFSTVDARQVGFQARSVVGGVYMPMLRDAETWKKWVARAR